MSVLQASHHVAPSGIGIRDGFPDLGAGTVLEPFVSIHTFMASMTGLASS